MHASAEIPEFMRAAMLLGPERIEIRDVPVEPPGQGEFLLRIEAATTCGTDVKVYRAGGHRRMLKVPTLFGHEMAGTIAAVGAGVDGFKAGDAVAVANSAPCRECAYCRANRENLCSDLQYLNGAFAEYLLVPERFVRTSVHRIPAGLGFEKAALAEPLACVLHGLEACGLDARDGAEAAEVVVCGAGPIGLLHTAALKRAGHRVVLTDLNRPRLEVGRKLGADETVEIERGDGRAETVKARTGGGQGADVAIECTGAPAVWEDAIVSVKPGGLVCLFGGLPADSTVNLDPGWVHYSEITVKGVYHHRPATVRRALEMLSDPAFAAELLLFGERPIDEVEEALGSMMDKKALKVVIKGVVGQGR